MNATLNSTSVVNCTDVSAPTALSFITASLSLVFFFVIVTGNLLIILAIVRDPYGALKKPFMALVGNLACADLIVGLVVTPLSFVLHIKEGLNIAIGMSSIRVIHLSYFISCTASLLSMTAITVDRHIAIAFPMYYKFTYLRRKLAIRSFVLIWPCLSLLLFKPHFNGLKMYRISLTLNAFNLFVLDDKVPGQVLGFEVDTVNSVQLSNHTGYVGCKSFLEEVLKVVEHLREANPNLVFVCDPVMGDNGKFYVPEELLPVYRDHLVPRADIATPNQFEAEMLTGIKIETENDAFKAMKVLHDKGTKTVVITSSELKKNMLVALGSSYRDGKHVSIRMEIPKLDVTFTGTGDLFTSLLLAWAYKHPNNLQLACEKTMSTVQTILKRTVEDARQKAKEDDGYDN
ncbi:hypothetical protein QZH41_004391, partial [Actinostola sp. cb2023]